MALWTMLGIDSIAKRELTTLSARDAVPDYGRVEPLNRELIWVGAFIALAWMCQAQVLLIGCTTFKRLSGLYFWSVCVATVAVASWTIGVVLIRFADSTERRYAAIVLVMFGCLIWPPSQYLFIYSRFHLLQPGPVLARSLKWAFILEWTMAEIPANCLYLVAVYKPSNYRLNLAVKVYTSTAAVFCSGVLLTAASVYLYLAWRMFWNDGSARVKRVILSMFGGTFIIFAMYSVNLGIWFSDLIVVRGCYLVFEASATLLVEFWILNNLGQLAASTPRGLATIDVEQLETLPVPRPAAGNTGGIFTGEKAARDLVRRWASGSPSTSSRVEPIGRYDLCLRDSDVRSHNDGD